MKTENYKDQQTRLPQEGRHILADHDADSIVVYQAYCPAIGHFAAEQGYFGGQFSFSRMTWIKTNFLWMMYRSGWGTKEGQEVALAITLKKSFFDKVVAQAVPAMFRESEYQEEADWKQALCDFPIRSQWDPDRDPAGNAISRRALQIGIKGELVKEYAQEAIVKIEDISEFVESQRASAVTGDFSQVMMPVETVYYSI
ncbi:MAG: DUF4291 domain-containing protein [Thiotrichaceae bacterium]|nr:DUF4291 domain-containing protein [Thiotrichaceae bacterium]